jgi:hypothetical protein
MDRRGFLKTAGLTTAGVALAGLTEGSLLAPSSWADIAKSGSGDTFGASIQTVQGQSVKQGLLALEALAGRKFATVHQRMPWQTHLVNSYSNFIAHRGQVPILSWFTRGHGGNVPWADIAAGLQDDRIIAEATALKSAGWPAYFCFHKEPENEPSLGNASDWKAAHERVFQIFESVGVRNATIIACFMAPTFDGGNGGLNAWLPLHFDALGADGYNRNLNGNWRSFRKIFSPAHKAAKARGRRWFVVEHGCVEGAAGQKGQWFTDAIAVAKSWPELIATSYNHEAGHSGIDAAMNYRVDTSRSSIEGFKAMGAAPFFNPAQTFFSPSGVRGPKAGGSSGHKGGGALPAPPNVHDHQHHTQHPKSLAHHNGSAKPTRRKLWARLNGGSLGS